MRELLWVDVIEKEVPFIDIKPYSHNIIGIALGAIAKLDSQHRANELIEEFGLDKLGWSKIIDRNNQDNSSKV